MAKHSRDSPSPPVTPNPKRLRTGVPSDDEMDRKVLDDRMTTFISSGELTLEEATLLLLSITEHSSGQLDILNIPQARNFISNNPSLLAALRRCWAVRRFAGIRKLKLQAPMPSGSAIVLPQLEQAQSVPRDQSIDATEKAWAVTYTGESHNVLWSEIKKVEARSLGNWYSHLLPITQSSGTGKSRMIDELSKEHFVIPMILRSSNGYPPSDIALRQWFTQQSTPESATKCASAFLAALFQQTTEVIDTIDGALSSLSIKEPHMTISAKFRLYMSYEQSYSSVGDLRKSFYEDVVRIGRELESDIKVISVDRSPRYTSKERDLSEYAKDLIKCLQVEENTHEPAFILAFDEAQVLTTMQYHDGKPWSFYSELGRVLRSLSKDKFFSLFLSTSGSIHQFTPPRDSAPSVRIQQGILDQNGPFTAVGFDQLAVPIKRGEMTIYQASSNDNIALLGRPLFGSRYLQGSTVIKDMIVSFAREKLVGPTEGPLGPQQQLSCLAMRIPIQFDLTSSIGALTAASLVENHMRLCLEINPKSSIMTTISPSEPLLAEAARDAISHATLGFSAAKALEMHLNMSGLDKGNRGELIAMLLFTLAYDEAARLHGRVVGVIDFLKALIPAASMDSVLNSHPYYQRDNFNYIRLQDSFSEAQIWFNHFVKVHDSDVLSRKYLWGLMARGAAVICADGQAGVDIVIPFIVGDHILREENIGAILVQVKNDKKFTAKPSDWLYGGMDPVDLGIFPDDNEIPVIRMVLALASKNAAVIAREREGRPLRGGRAPLFTSYDIWFAKICSETFRPIKAEDEATYSTMLRLTTTFPTVYGNDTTEVLLRNMNPGSTAHPAHWRHIDYGDDTVDPVANTQESKMGERKTKKGKTKKGKMDKGKGKAPVR